MSVSVCVCVSLRPPLGEGRWGVHAAPLPASCHTVPPKSDRQRQTHCQGPQISYSLSTHPSVRMCQLFLASICCLCISLSCSLCLSFTLSHTLISANLYNVHSNSKYALRLSRMLCFMCYESNQIACSSLHILQPPAVDVDITIKMLSFCNRAL